MVRRLDEMQKIVAHPDCIHYKSKHFVRKAISMNYFLKTVKSEMYSVPVNQYNITKNSPPFLRYKIRLAYWIVRHYTYL